MHTHTQTLINQRWDSLNQSDKTNFLRNPHMHYLILFMLMLCFSTSGIYYILLDVTVCVCVCVNWIRCHLLCIKSHCSFSLEIPLVEKLVFHRRIMCVNAISSMCVCVCDDLKIITIISIEIENDDFRLLLCFRLIITNVWQKFYSTHFIKTYLILK